MPSNNRNSTSLNQKYEKKNKLLTKHLLLETN